MTPILDEYAEIAKAQLEDERPEDEVLYSDQVQDRAVRLREESKSQRYVYAWGPRFVVAGLPVLDRKVKLCKLLVRGKRMNSALVEFIEDGERHIISRNALRRVKP